MEEQLPTRKQPTRKSRAGNWKDAPAYFHLIGGRTMLCLTAVTWYFNLLVVSKANFPALFICLVEIHHRSPNSRLRFSQSNFGLRIFS